MHTYAALKRRLRVGTTVTMTRHDWYPTGKLIGVPRDVTRVMSNAVELATPMATSGYSRMDLPSARDVVITGPDTFDVALESGNPDGPRMSYRIDEVAS